MGPAEPALPRDSTIFRMPQSHQNATKPPDAQSLRENTYPFSKIHTGIKGIGTFPSYCSSVDKAGKFTLLNFFFKVLNVYH